MFSWRLALPSVWHASSCSEYTEKDAEEDEKKSTKLKKK